MICRRHARRVRDRFWSFGLDCWGLSVGAEYLIAGATFRVRGLMPPWQPVRSTTLSEFCIRGNGSASAMCGRISPLGVFIRFGTMQVAGCHSGLAPNGGFGWLAGSRFADNSVLQPLNSRAVHSRYASLHYIAFASPETLIVVNIASQHAELINLIYNSLL